MNADRGLFIGQDGDLLYVVMDATFYRMEIFLRPPGISFTAGALIRIGGDPAIRVLCNGQYVGGGKTAYSLATPDFEQNFDGQLVIDHLPTRFLPPEVQDLCYRHIGQWDGRSEGAFAVARGEPGDVVPGYRNGMGTLLPAIDDRIPFGAKELRDGTGRVTQGFSSGIAAFLKRDADTGVLVAGLHRSSQSLLVLVQPDDPPGNGIGLQAVIDRLKEIGVDDAVVPDGSDSVTLVVDGVIEATPATYKDNSITSGLMFRLQALTLDRTAQATVRPTTLNARFPPSTNLSLFEGTIALVANGARLELTSLGHTGSSLAAGGTSTVAAGSTNATAPAGTRFVEPRADIVPTAGAFVTRRLAINSLGTRAAGLGALGWLSAGGLSSDPEFPPNTVVSGPVGQFRVSVESGGELEIQSIGARQANVPIPARNAAQTAALLGITLPLRLTSTSAPPGVLAHYVGPAATAELQIQFPGTANVAVVGVLMITTGRGIAQFAVQWPLSATPTTELEVAAQLGVPVPLALQSPFQDLSQVVLFVEEGPASPEQTRAHLQRLAVGGPHGSLVGTIEITKPAGEVTLDVQWPLTSPVFSGVETAAELGVNLPLLLTATESNLAIATSFSGPPGSNVAATLQIESTKTTDGAMRGTLSFGLPPQVELDVDWPLRS